jgi:terminase small subunit-like protein
LSKGRTPIDICRDDGMPAYATVRDWVRDDRHGFAVPYRKALRAGGARWARPIRYAADIADFILEGLCDGRTLEAVCADPDMPTATAVRTWVKQDRDGFAARYQRARWIGCDMLGDQMIDIADSRDDWIVRRRADGTTEIILDPDRIRRRRLQIKARYWRLSRMLRHVDGDWFEKPEPGDPDRGRE